MPMEDQNNIELTDDELFEMLSVLPNTPTLSAEDIEKAVVNLREAVKAKAIADSTRPSPRLMRLPLPGTEGNKKTG